jgi:hypothetical protein
MTSFLLFWEIDLNKMPADTTDRRELLIKILKFMKGRLAKMGGDFGVFGVGVQGYSIVEGTEEDVSALIWQFGPAIKWTVHPVLTVDQSIKIFENMNRAPI